MRLPPLKALPVFEAVARLRSFSQAANELAITQSAVSHQIKQLETYLGERLFWRSGRVVTLTDEGRQYFDAGGSALMQIERASEQLLGHEEARLRLSVFSSFAVRWLVPRLPYLQRLHPQLDLALEAFLGHAPDADIARQIAAASGPSGANAEYLLRLAESLRAMGAQCPHTFAIERRLLSSSDE
ncbi:MAG TPA: LysR family transcriptional regulator [Marinobacter sp.]|nr:LysR family transcriptional regulator [Marinobacter sp.]